MLDFSFWGVPTALRFIPMLYGRARKRSRHRSPRTRVDNTNGRDIVVGSGGHAPCGHHTGARRARVLSGCNMQNVNVSHLHRRVRRAWRWPLSRPKGERHSTSRSRGRQNLHKSPRAPSRHEAANARPLARSRPPLARPAMECTIGTAQGTAQARQTARATAPPHAARAAAPPSPQEAQSPG